MMNNDFEFLLLVIGSAIAVYVGYTELLKTRKIWMRDIYLERETSGFFASTFSQLKECDPEQFRIATRMQPASFDALFDLVGERLEKNSIRPSIPAKCRLFLTLTYLAHGTSRQNLSLTFKMSVESVRRIAMETCEIIWQTLSPIYLSLPKSQEWRKVAEDFKNIWNLPNCVGAIGGKCVNVICPARSGSNTYNDKKTSSITLLGVCDANYSFTVVDIRAFGSQNDEGILMNSMFGEKLFRNKLNLPPQKTLPNSDIDFPHYFVGDVVFPLKSYLMKPYPGLHLDNERVNFNKRLARVRRVMENTFGILTGRWQILQGSLNMTPDSAVKIVNATSVLHNYLQITDDSYNPPEYADRETNGELVEGLWRKEVKPLRNFSFSASHNAAQSAFQLRDILKNFLFTNKI